MADTLTPSHAQDVSVATGIAGNTASQAIPGAPIKSQLAAMLLSNRRLLLFIAGSLMLAAFISMVMWSSKTPYQPVYAGMAAADASAVVDYLQKEHIPYQLQGAGTVLVPADQVYAVRLKLAGQDITPGGAMGFELFDKKGEFGISDFTQQVNYQRALQGELARTIEVMPRIAAARVQLVLPKDSAFADRERKASASVMLKLAGGQRLTKQNVMAIQSLVAASVQSLDIKAVTVVDASGNLLSNNEEQAPMNAGQTLQDVQTQMERRLEARLTGMLEQVVGAGQAVVRVTTDIDRQVVEQNSKRFNPDEQVIRSQKETTESRKSVDASPIGIPGTASNTPDANPANNNATNSPAATTPPQENANRNERTTNYEISSTTEHRIIPSGGIKKISVAAIVGGTFKKPGDASTFTPRGKQELKTLQGLIERAIGYDEDRGDSVEIQSMPLMDIASHADTGALETAANRALYMDIARYGLAGLALLLLAWFVLRPLSQRITSQSAGGTHTGGEAFTPQALPAMSPAAYARLESTERARQVIINEPDRASRVVSEWIEHT
ncbi:MAG: flagellar basal-body MS-ring/collar protein FliF [Zetaproteobacteria bacterium]|nr:MAG: flagellar basal-body MS-ring/collar protein FliF [Zetaproteobacteria bacterium]